MEDVVKALWIAERPPTLIENYLPVWLGSTITFVAISKLGSTRVITHQMHLGRVSPPLNLAPLLGHIWELWRSRAWSFMPGHAY